MGAHVKEWSKRTIFEKGKKGRWDYVATMIAHTNINRQM